MPYRRADDIDFALADLPALPRPGRVLLTTPDHFEIAYVINPHMEGHVGTVDRGRAGRQWRVLRDAYEQLGVQPMVVDGVEGLPDMVFCANQTLPYLAPATGDRGVVLSQMYAPERRPEVASYARFFERIGYTVHALPPDAGPFEGMGDALWHPGRFLLWGGHGIRTAPTAYDHLEPLLDVRILRLRLEDPDFYHLDTCLSLLDEETALYFPGAFDAEGRALLARMIPRLVEAPEEEARHRFACNAHCPDGHHVLIQRDAPVTAERLRTAGFTPVELDTDEYLKAGGSVFCMKLMFW